MEILQPGFIRSDLAASAERLRLNSSKPCRNVGQHGIP